MQRAYFFPRTRFHFQELRDIITAMPNLPSQQRLKIGAERVKEMLYAHGLSLQSGVTFQPRKKGSHREVMEFKIAHPSLGDFSCTYYSPGMLTVNCNNDGAMYLEESNFIFRSLFAAFPYAHRAFEDGLGWGECDVRPNEKPSQIFTTCCNSFAGVLIDAIRSPEIVTRLTEPANPEGQIWPMSGRKHKRTRESDKRLLYAFDVKEYLEQANDCLEYFDKHIEDIDPSDKAAEQMNIVFLTKWAMMRQERAETITELERHSGEVILQKLLAIIAYETIVLTLVQVVRTLINSPPEPPPDAARFLLPVLVFTLLPLVPIAVFHNLKGRLWSTLAIFAYCTLSVAYLLTLALYPNSISGTLGSLYVPVFMFILTPLFSFPTHWFWRYLESRR